MTCTVPPRIFLSISLVRFLAAARGPSQRAGLGFRIGTQMNRLGAQPVLSVSAKMDRHEGLIGMGVLDVTLLTFKLVSRPSSLGSFSVYFLGFKEKAPSGTIKRGLYTYRAEGCLYTPLYLRGYLECGRLRRFVSHSDADVAAELARALMDWASPLSALSFSLPPPKEGLLGACYQLSCRERPLSTLGGSGRCLVDPCDRLQGVPWRGPFGDA
ncbi:hypothetical protein BHM03_00010642 [Ensete ventricosum]|nr:hypothetical protein BHM03_00010642 [Ensete ventricosum]